MKQVSGSDALRKAKKNIRKVFADEESAPDINTLHKLLSNKEFRNVIELYDRLTGAPEVESVEPDFLGIVQSSLDDLFNAGEENEEARELAEILIQPNFRSFVEAYNDIAKKQFVVELPIRAERSAGPGLGASVLSGSNKDRTEGDVGPTSPGAGQELEIGGGVNGGPIIRHPQDGALKMVGIRKEKGEDLGITIGCHKYTTAEYGTIRDIVVERIMAGSRVEQQGLLHEGDVIREVNGIPVDAPDTLQKLMQQATGTITLKVIPSYKEKPSTAQLFLRAHQSYDPNTDGLIPCKEAGLAFTCGDILQILSQEDPHWWQARLFNTDGCAGLIPSLTLQERRRAFNESAPDPNEVAYHMFCGLGRRKKKVKYTFLARDADDYEKTDIVVYEEVARIPGFQRQVICLIGPPAVGRRTIKEMILRANPDRYATALPHTSRPMRPNEVNGDKYFFTNRSAMEADLAANRYLEVGEFNGNLYGIKVDTVRSVMKTGRTCLMDVGASALKLLRTQEFMPYVIFIAAPSVDCMKAMYEYGRSMNFTSKWKKDEDFRAVVDQSIQMERKYRHFFDYIIVNDNMDITADKLITQLNELLTNHQWVPAKWLY